MAKKPADVKEPNLYQLSGYGIQVSYSTTSITGKPQFNYHDASQSHLFTGKEIRTVDTEIGTLVSVTILLQPDFGSTSFTLLIPHVGLGLSDTAQIVTEAITTLHKTSIVGPPLQGQTDFYTVHRLNGTASFVRF